jgi:flagellar motor switch protein FliG
VSLQNRIGQIPVRPGGIDRASNVLREIARPATQSVLQTLEQKDVGLANALRNSMFSFKQLGSLNDAQFQLVLEKTDHCQWAVALKGSSRELRDRVFKCLSPQVANGLRDEINSIGPIPISRITAVQRQIADTILRLDGDDQIELPRQSTRIRPVENV